MREELHNLKNEALALIQEAEDKKELETLRIAFLGRKGKVNQFLKKLVKLNKQEKAIYGQLINETKSTIEQTLKTKFTTYNLEPTTKEFFDVTLPGIKPSQGHLHPISQTIEEITRIFEKIGFTRVRYPEVDWDWYVFEALNMPKDHPARDEWETIFIDQSKNPKMGKVVLTTHTSNGQLREMERVKKPPIRMLNLGKCYRRQQDPTHTIMFHQFEGLVIDKNINISHLKGTLDYFGKQFFWAGN